MPERILHRLGPREKFTYQLCAAAIYRRQFRSQCNARGACERREIHQQIQNPGQAAGLLLLFSLEHGFASYAPVRTDTEIVQSVLQPGLRRA